MQLESFLKDLTARPFALTLLIINSPRHNWFDRKILHAYENFINGIQVGAKYSHRPSCISGTAAAHHLQGYLRSFGFQLMNSS